MVGKKLRQLRKKCNYSLRELAKLTGLSHGFTCDMEHDRCNPSVKNLLILADALDTKIEFFLTQVVAKSDQKCFFYMAIIPFIGIR